MTADWQIVRQKQIRQTHGRLQIRSQSISLVQPNIHISVLIEKPLVSVNFVGRFNHDFKHQTKRNSNYLLHYHLQ